MSAAPPLVSIVLPTHNGRRYLAEAVESILAQTYERWELVVVDDASTDDTPALIERLAARDPRIRVVRNERNLRLPASLNRGFGLTRGELVTWTSDDNRHHPDALAELVAVLAARPEVDVVFSDYVVVDDAGRPLPTPPGGTGVGDVDALPLSNTIGACFLYRRHVHERLDGYAEDLFLVEDYDFWLRAAARFRFAFVDRPLYDYRQHGGSLTAQRAAQIRLGVERCLARDLPGLTGMDVRTRAAAWARVVDHALARGDRRAAAGHVLRAVARGRVRPRALGLGRLAAVFEPAPAREWRLRRRLRRLARRIFALAPDGRPVLLLDDGRWGDRVREGGRRAEPLLPGVEAADADALDRLRARAGEAPLLVVGAPAFWRLEAPAPLADWLRTHARCLLDDESVRVWAIDRAAA